jgi:hypothetical protein
MGFVPNAWMPMGSIRSCIEPRTAPQVMIPAQPFCIACLRSCLPAELCSSILRHLSPAPRRVQTFPVGLLPRRCLRVFLRCESGRTHDRQTDGTAGGTRKGLSIRIHEICSRKIIHWILHFPGRCHCESTASIGASSVPPRLHQSAKDGSRPYAFPANQ